MEKVRLNILSLEDSQNDFEIICEMLHDEGFDFNAKRVENQNEFIDSIQNNKYDVILSDFSLPGFNAFGALEISLNYCPETPFIVVSGSIGEVTAIELIKKGAVDYVLKDNPDRLPFAVKRSLEEAKEIKARKQAEEALLKKLRELEIFHQVTVGREIKMIELKKEINTLLIEAGKKPKYMINE